jgi:hypothetical protein
MREIRIDAVWLVIEPIDMRAGVHRLLAASVQVFGSTASACGAIRAPTAGLLCGSRSYECALRGLINRSMRVANSCSLGVRNGSDEAARWCPLRFNLRFSIASPTSIAAATTRPRQR